MKVNDLIELLEYSPAQVPVGIAVVDPQGNVRCHDEPLFLTKDGRVYLVADQRSEAGATAAATTDTIELSDYQRPQLFGHRFVLLQRPDHAS